MNFYCAHGFLNVLSASRYVVPAWRRGYDWPQERCDAFLQDVLRVGAASGPLPQERPPTHFLGTALVTARGLSNSGPTRLVVDGAQRIVTSFLLLLALIRELDDRSGGRLVDEQGKELTTSEELLSAYVHPTHASEPERYRLELAGAEGQALRSLIEQTPRDPVDASSVFISFDNFRNRLAVLPDLNVLMNGLMRLHFAAIELDARQDAYDAFRLVNYGATGPDAAGDGA